jgi:Rad52/22 family double-strand break repair protein
MAYVNGADGTNHNSSQSAAVAAIATGDNTHTVQMSPERLQNIRELLSEPFDPGEIKGRGDFNTQSKQGSQKRGQLVAYADQRAYTDRLNEVFCEWGWTRSYDVQVVQHFERRAPGGRQANCSCRESRGRFQGDRSRARVAHRHRRGMGR